MIHPIEPIHNKNAKIAFPLPAPSIIEALVKVIPSISRML
jgi:hypothetical protein